MSTYERIKEIAASSGLKVTDLLALAPQNDPFYAGTETDRAQAAWFKMVWQRAGYSTGVHLRRVHYFAVSQSPQLLMHNGSPYENTDKCWGYLCQASKMARYLGLVRISDINDNKNPAPHISADYLGIHEPGYTIYTPNLSDPYVSIQGLDEVDAQPYHLEVWCEKSTMNDVLLPLCRRYNANLATFEGEVSLSACHALTTRIQASGSKPTRIWYLSDFDPAGNSMPVATARKVEYLLAVYKIAADVRLQPLALTTDQVTSYHLPRTPIKASEKRAARFEDAFGEGAVELDALEAIYPGELASIVDEAVSPYYSDEAAQETQRRRDALQEEVDARIAAITGRYQEQIDALRGMFDELQGITVDASEYKQERFAPHVDEPDGWLFDSSRNYVDQIARYKAHKSNGGASK
jgi:hypothetical protein